MSRLNVRTRAEFRARAVQMVAEVRANYESEWAAIGAVAQKLGFGTAGRSSAGPTGGSGSTWTARYRQDR